MTGRTLDTSVLIPALHNRHASHQAYVRQIATADTLMQPVALEAIAEISRRPHGLAGSAQQVWPALQDTFPGPVATLSQRVQPVTQMTQAATLHDRRAARLVR